MLSCNAPLLRCNDPNPTTMPHGTVAMHHVLHATTQIPLLFDLAWLQRPLSARRPHHVLLQRSITAWPRVNVSLQRRKCSQTRSVAVKQRGRGVLHQGGVGKSNIPAAWRWAIVRKPLFIVVWKRFGSNRRSRLIGEQRKVDGRQLR